MPESDSSLKEKALYLVEIEKLSRNEVMRRLKVGSRRLKRLLGETPIPPRPKKPSPLEAFRPLIDEWFGRHPRLQATEVHRRLKEYGLATSRSGVERFTRGWRIKKSASYHALDFLPGEEAQIDWFFAKLENLGQTALFLYVLSHSRYAFGKFYPKTSFEFFLAAHLEAFAHLRGLARTHRYDNLKSVVLKHTHEKIEYNPQFLEFARHYGFRIHACNPYKGNEKGRVERLGRDVRGSFLYARTFKDHDDLNSGFAGWLSERNARLHRSTGSSPLELLRSEKLLALPRVGFEPRKIIQGTVSKTALVEFDRNRYSVPSSLALKTCQIAAYPDKIEILVGDKKVARHKRSFDRHKVFQNPLHHEALLNRSPLFKYRRILGLIASMETVFGDFLAGQEDDAERLASAYEIFRLLKTHSRAVVVSGVRELLSIGTYKTKALLSLLGLERKEPRGELYPSDRSLLNIRYEERSLKDYDPDP
jgi:transposase